MMKYLILMCCMMSVGYTCYAGEPDRVTNLQRADAECISLETVAKTKTEISLEVSNEEDEFDPDSLFERESELDECALGRWLGLV